MNFNTIPINILTPGVFVEFDKSRAIGGLLSLTQKVLLIGQRLPAGSVLANAPTRVLSKAQGELFFGRGSMLSGMVNAFKDNNEYTDLYACALDDVGGGAQASGTLTVTGPATAAGTLNIYIAGKRLQVAVANAATATQIATAIVAAVTADTSLPVTAGNVAGVVTLTARHKGEVGNSIDVRLNYNFGDALPAGVAVAVVAMAGGTTNPDIATVLAAIGATQYHVFAMPYIDATNLAAIEAELATRWEGMNTNDGHLFSAHYGTHAQASTLVSANRNSPHVSILPTQKSPSPVWEVAAALAAQDTAEPDPSRQRRFLPLKGMLPPAEVDRYTRAERNTHLVDGLATFITDEGGVCRIDRLVTTYIVNESAAPDPSYRDRERLATLSYIRQDIRAFVSSKFPRHKLAKDGTEFAAGQAIVTPKIMRGELIARAQLYVESGLVEDIDQFKKDLIVEIPSTDPDRLDVLLSPNIINNLRVVATQIQFQV